MEYEDGIDYFIDKEIEEMNKDSTNNFNTFSGILNYYLNKPNYIDKIKKATDKEQIKQLNKEIIPNSFVYDVNETLKKAFIEHLYRGHSDMQYGIYFSMIYAKDDNDLKEKLHAVDRPTREDRIIMYTKLDKLVEYVIKIKTDKNFSLPLLYANSGWHYGEIEDSSILMGNDGKNFIDTIKKKYPPESKHRLVEIISQIPLPSTEFNFFFVSDQSGGYKNKYLKYKNKYLKLKQYYLSKK